MFSVRYGVLMSVKDVRVEQLRELIREQGGSNKAVAALLKKKPAQISQWLSGYRTITEESARDIEAAAGKPPGWMDSIPLSAQATATARATADLSVGKPPELEQALPVVLDAIARCSQQAELMDRLRMLAQYGRPEDRQRVAELLGALPGSELDQAA